MPCWSQTACTFSSFLQTLSSGVFAMRPVNIAEAEERIAGDKRILSATATQPLPDPSGSAAGTGASSGLWCCLRLASPAQAAEALYLLETAILYRVAVLPCVDCHLQHAQMRLRHGMWSSNTDELSGHVWVNSPESLVCSALDQNTQTLTSLESPHLVRLAGLAEPSASAFAAALTLRQARTVKPTSSAITRAPPPVAPSMLGESPEWDVRACESSPPPPPAPVHSHQDTMSAHSASCRALLFLKSLPK